ncbi:MAG: hypothetical protein FJ264_16835 [Planctomycetes bacterium]|nr:hypothetical protein [Planctomycetota bacterium]
MNLTKYRSIFFFSIVFFCVSFATAIISSKIANASDCKPKSIQTSPEKTLTLQKGKSANVTVKLKCKDGSPASGVTIETKVLKGNKNISYSPKSSVTDSNGKAVFAITGDKKTEEENAEIKFKTDTLNTTLGIKVQAEECDVGSLSTSPDKKLTLKEGESSEVTVKAKCKNGSPAVDVKVDAIIQSGSDSIKLSSSAGLTDESGKVVFTVSGTKKTKKEAATIKFSTDNIKTTLDVKVKQETEESAETSSAIETKTAVSTEKASETTTEETTETESAGETATEEVVEESVSEEETSETAADTAGEETSVIATEEAAETTTEEVTEAESAEETTSGEETSAGTTETTTTEKTSEETIKCTPKLIITHPDKKLTLEKGKKANITVKVKCKGESPAVGVKLEAHVKKGMKYITLTPKSAETDENGKAIFTVSGDKKTDTELAEIKFKADKLHTTLEVKVQAEACDLGNLVTNPEKKLNLKEGESSEVTVKAKCKNGSPAVDVKIDAIVQGGSGKVEVSPTGKLTDESGKAQFTVKGIKKTAKKDKISVKFSSGDIKSILDINVQ